MPAPPIEEGMISMAISESDLLTFANLMSICAKTFEELAMAAAQENKPIVFKTLQARYQLSVEFAARLTDVLRMPEPVSRDMH